MLNILSIKTFNDHELIEKAKNVNTLEKKTLASFLIYLGEIDRRRLYAKEGYPSLFAFVQKEFYLGNGSTGKRVKVARMGLKFPELIKSIADGSLHLSGAYQLAKSDKKENLNALIEKAKYKSENEIIEMLTSLDVLKPVHRESIKPVEPLLPETKINISEKNENFIQPQNLPLVTTPLPIVKNDSPTTSPSKPTKSFEDKGGTKPKEKVEPDYRLGITVTKEVLDKIKRLQDITGKAKISDVLEKAVDHYLDAIDPEKREAKREKRREKREAKKTEKEKGIKEKKAEAKNSLQNKRFSHAGIVARKSNHNRYIPIKIRDKVFERDGYQCTYIDSKGRRCQSRRHLQIDHKHPFAANGNHELSNLRLRCFAHNLLAAQDYFGAEFIEKKIDENRPF